MTTPAFAEVRVDDNLIIYHTVGGPLFSTTVVVVNSGRESRNADWPTPLGRWELGERPMMPGDLMTIKNFFNARQGRAQGFRFKDWMDYKDEGGGVLVPIVGGTGYQMYKKYPSGPNFNSRKISKPIAGTVKVYSGGTLQTGASVDTTTGIVTGVSGSNLTWTGEFDVPVRFDTDQLKAEFIGATGAGGAAGVHDVYFHLFSLPIVELRL
jgi:uncharacterized protein (TIGR02217 family)